MSLPFLDRTEELGRLRALIARGQGGLAVLYGRRRCGKSRLVQQALRGVKSVYYVGDARDESLQRVNLAREIGRLLPGFGAVVYPDWNSLLERWWDTAPPGSVLALDEFPALVSAAADLPSLLQKQVDQKRRRGPHLILTGSSQTMMQGIVLDRSAPLYGRADEILRVGPLPVGWIGRALALRDPVDAVRAYSVWGGVPRYWELAREHVDLETAVERLVLSPLGVLHDEPPGLLHDDMRETAQAASILSLIGAGCHRISEIAGRLGKPATSLSRPIARLVDLELIERSTPFDTSSRDSNRTMYRIHDPFLQFWFRFVEPNRSRLQSPRAANAVGREIAARMPHHLAWVWEELARRSVESLPIHDRVWTNARRWWGKGVGGRQLEIDVVARSAQGRSLLLGEAKWGTSTDPGEVLEDLRSRARLLPFVSDYESICFAVFLPRRKRGPTEVEVIDSNRVLRALR